MAAVANNGICGVGVAYNAKIGGMVKEMSQVFLCFWTDCIWNALLSSVSEKLSSSSMGDPERATSVHKSDKPNYMKIEPPLDRVRYL